MTCPTCHAQALNLQSENSLLAQGSFFYCEVCENTFSQQDVKVAELAHWKAIDEVFAGTVTEDFDQFTGKLIDYSTRL